MSRYATAGIVVGVRFTTDEVLSLNECPDFLQSFVKEKLGEVDSDDYYEWSYRMGKHLPNGVSFISRGCEEGNDVFLGKNVQGSPDYGSEELGPVLGRTNAWVKVREFISSIGGDPEEVKIWLSADFS